MDLEKVPGLDGLTMAFFQECWHIVQHDLLELFREFHSNRKIRTSLNATFIYLIPKKTNAAMIQDSGPLAWFLPPSRFIAKVLSIRIRTILHEVIDGNQYAFI